jgi:hypothetical protein
VSDFVPWLRRFNAKERAWVIENALGPTALSDSFRLRLSEKLALDEAIKPTAWWSIDYHIDWLFAALRCRELGADWGDGDSFLVEENPGHYTYRIEDIDLVLCDGRRVVLIEAKAYGAWGSEQIRSKMARLAPLAKLGAAQGIEFHFVLMSPKPPQKLTYGDWPANWLANGQPAWLPLEAPAKRGLAINRCDETGKPSGKGQFYRITRSAADGETTPKRAPSS